MTSSATQTDRAGKGAPNTPDSQPGRQRGEQSAGALPGLPVPSTGLSSTGLSSTSLAWGVGIVALLGGWISILQVYRWHFTAPVFFLFAGWLAVLLAARSLWRAGMAAAEDTGVADDDLWKPAGPHDELMREKRSLLKAIKEIEFDHQMGKMSEEDATQLTRFYRLRAIEIIKALDESGEEGAGLSPSLSPSLSIEKQIEREVKARLTVSRTSAKAQAAAGQGESQRTAKSAKAGKQKGKKRATDEKTPAGETSPGSGEASGEASTEVGS